MNRVPLIDRSEARTESKSHVDANHGAFGTTPNMFRAVANSPAALKSMWGAFGALGAGVLVDDRLQVLGVFGRRVNGAHGRLLALVIPVVTETGRAD